MFERHGENQITRRKRATEDIEVESSEESLHGRSSGESLSSKSVLHTPFEKAVVYHHYTTIKSYFRICLSLHAYGYCCFVILIFSYGLRVAYVNVVLLLSILHDFYLIYLISNQSRWNPNASFSTDSSQRGS